MSEQRRADVLQFWGSTERAERLIEFQGLALSILGLLCRASVLSNFLLVVEDRVRGRKQAMSRDISPTSGDSNVIVKRGRDPEDNHPVVVSTFKTWGLGQARIRNVIWK